MKISIGILLLALLVPASQGQETLSREAALKFAFAACANLSALQNTAIPTDPDVKRPIVVRDGEYGCMVLPESKLSLSQLERTSGEVLPIGQLWIHKLAPLKQEALIDSSLYHVCVVETEEGSIETPMFALGFAKSADGKPEIRLYGKNQKPIVVAAAHPISRSQRDPITLTVDRLSDRGVLTLSILGKYEASLELTDPELY